MHTTRKDGTPTEYGFDCGHQQTETIGDCTASLYKEHGTYHVRAHDHGTHTRIMWQTFTAIPDARKAYYEARNLCADRLAHDPYKDAR